MNLRWRRLYAAAAPAFVTDDRRQSGGSGTSPVHDRGAGVIRGRRPLAIASILQNNRGMSTSDRYASFDYSRLINWDDRLRREWPFLETVLRDAPSRQILDLGSGTGEHARFLVAKGFEVLGIDASPAMLDTARATTEGENPRFEHGDMRDVTGLAGAHRFGGALCVGNALPHLTGEGDVMQMAVNLRKVLLPGAPVVIQILNYERYETKKERSLPLAFLPDKDDPESTIVFLRAMELHPGRRVTFMPTILRMRPDREPPMELVASQRVEIRGWHGSDLVEAFRAAGFAATELFGSYQRAPFEAGESRDVIFVARA